MCVNGYHQIMVGSTERLKIVVVVVFIGAVAV